VLEQATIAHPSDKALLAGYGRALADNGNFQQAFDVLSRAHTPEDPDWRILSAQGAVLDQLGRYEEARQYYASALKIVPDEPTVLSNLGLSYALSKDLPKAEETLRRAYARAGADARVRANLGLVVGLQGRLAEAEGIVKADLPAEEAAANVAYLRQLLSRKQKQGQMSINYAERWGMDSLACSQPIIGESIAHDSSPQFWNLNHSRPAERNAPGVVRLWRFRGKADINQPTTPR
jgi:Flp pilus assembly protein TadD